MIKDYLRMMRPDHWVKNVLILPGVLFAYFLTDANVFLPLRFYLLFMAVCFVTAANYVLNEWTDAAFDQYHPVKQLRPAVQQRVRALGVWRTYVICLGIGLYIAGSLSFECLAACLLLAVQGYLYNIKPFRLKDRFVLDVVFESVNNPLRFAIGWFFLSPSLFPPIALLFSYWAAGAFFMNMKRLAEYRFFQDKDRAGHYRRSFCVYTEKGLIRLSFLYAASAVVGWGFFAYGWAPRLLFMLPAVIIFFLWYGIIGLKKDSVAQSPEHLFLEPLFFLYSLIICFCVVYFLM